MACSISLVQELLGKVDDAAVVAECLGKLFLGGKNGVSADEPSERLLEIAKQLDLKQLSSPPVGGTLQGEDKSVVSCRRPP